MELESAAFNCEGRSGPEAEKWRMPVVENRFTYHGASDLVLATKLLVIVTACSTVETSVMFASKSKQCDFMEAALMKDVS